MKAVVATVLYCALLAVTASSQSVGSEPSPMEAFASHQGVRTTWSNEVARWEQDGTRLVLTAVVLEDSTRKIRGVRVDLSGENAKDQVYLDEQATERTRLALVEISDAVSLAVEQVSRAERQFLWGFEEPRAGLARQGQAWVLLFPR